MNLNERFGLILRGLRKDKEITQKELGKILDTTASTVNRWEKGIHEPNYDTLLKLSSFFKVTISYLLGENAYLDPDFGHCLTMWRQPDTVEQFAKKTGIPEQTLLDFEENKKEPTPKEISKIAKVLKMDFNDFYTDSNFDDFYEEFLNKKSNVKLPPNPYYKNNDPEAYTVPVLGTIAAGIPIEAQEEILDYEELPLKWKSQGTFFGLKIKGDSMDPKISDGDTVIIKKQEDIESGDVAAVMVNGNEATVKKITKDQNGITLIPFNIAKYEPITYTNEEIEVLPVKIIGKVVELRAKF